LAFPSESNLFFPVFGILKNLLKKLENFFEVFYEINISEKGKEALNREMLLKRLKALNDTEYFIQNLDLENLQSEVYLPFKELTSIKRKLLFRLNNSREFIDPIDIPVLTKQSGVKSNPTLSVLISSQEDIRLCNETAATVYFQLPDSFKSEIDHFVDLFRKNEKLIPWFPSVLLGDDYSAAVEFLEQLQPKTIVTDNTGIAYEAYKKGIPWIAGPSLNSVNSFSLLCLKENFNCLGAFISNEVSKAQIKGIKKPENFELYFSMYHPIVLMTSRQCLFHQVTGCEKDGIDNACISHCEKSASITNLKNDSFLIKKAKGNYHRIYNETNYLNTEVVSDFPELFSDFMIDFRDSKTKTNLTRVKRGT